MSVTQSPMSQLRIGTAFCLIGLLLLVSACEKVEVGEIEVKPAKNVETGQSAAVGANIENPKGRHLQITWHAERGKVTSASESSAAGIYTAPLEPGPDSITLEVRSGDKLIASKVAAINVTGLAGGIAGIPPPKAKEQPAQTEKEEVIQLAPAPDSWGCPRASSQGAITYLKKAPGALKGTVELSGLESQQTYALTLNGWPNRAGNDVLAEYNRAPNDEGYLDFDTVQTDERGNAKVELDVSLRPGKYHVKFFVKNQGSDWCVVLFNDHLGFEVE